MFDHILEIFIQFEFAQIFGNSLITRRLNKINSILNSSLIRFYNRQRKFIKKLLSYTNIILVNCLVLSYYGGKINASSISEWFVLFLNFDIWLKKQLILSLILLFGRYVMDIIVFIIKVLVIVLVLVSCYHIIKGIFRKIKRCLIGSPSKTT